MQILRQGFLGLAVMAGLVANSFTASAQQISGPTCITHLTPTDTDPNPTQPPNTYEFSLPANATFGGWGTKGDVEIVGTPSTTPNPVTSRYTATVRSKGYGRGEVRAYYSFGGCASQETRYPVNQSFDALTNDKLTAPDCVQGGGTYAFTVPPIISSTSQIGEQIGIDSYYWDPFPAGSQVDYSGDGSAATVTLPADFSGSFTVGVIIGECNNGNANKKMTKVISSRPSTPNINVTTGAYSCKNDLSPFTLSYNVQSGVNYLWRIPSGWQISPAGANVGTGISYTSPGLQTVTITPSNTNADNVSVTAKFPSGTGCGNGEATSNIIQVTYQLTSANIINISSTGCLTPGSSVNLSVGGTSSNTSIQWGLPTGWSITSTNPNDNRITVSVGTEGGNITASAVGCPGAISLPVNVSGNNGCAPGTYTIELGNSRRTYFYVSNSTPSCLPDGSVSGPGITYTWNAGGQIKVTNSPEVLFTTAVPVGTNITVHIQDTNNCRDVTAGNAARTTLGNRQAASLKGAMAAYPNPTKEQLNVDLTLQEGTEAQLTITDMLGRTVQQTATRHAHTELNVGNLPKGTYMLRATLPNGKSIAQKIEVQH